MNLPLLAALFGLIILCLGAFILLGRSSFKQQEKTDYHFSNRFPFELLNAFPAPFALLAKLLVIAGSFGFIVFGFFAFPFPNLYQAIFVMVGFLLSGLLWIGLLITDMRYIKLHLLMASLYFVMVAFTSAAVAYFAWTSPYDLFHPALPFVAGALSLAELVIAFNPRLKRWETLEAVAQKDGSVTYERPKRFVLPFSEWLTTLILLVLTAFILLSALLN